MENNMKTTDKIIRYVGGEKNITNLYHCATRLRFNLIDKSKFNISALEKMPEVLAAVDSGDEAQIVIGGKVGSYYQEIMKTYKIGDDNNNGIKENSQNKDTNLFKRLINVLVNIMSPIIVVLIAGGMFKVVLAILVLFGLNKQSMNYQILNFMADSAFYFLPFMLANSAAKKFNTNPYLAMMMAGVLLHPNFITLVTSGKPISLFGVPIRLVSYGSSVIPIILIVWFMSYIDHICEKIIPNIVKTMLKPLLIVIITAPIALIIIGPLGSLLGDGLFSIVSFLNKHVSWLIPTVIGIFSPLLVMIGMHVSLLPLSTISFAKYGSENIMGPGQLASNLSQAGAAMAIFIREKNRNAKEIALSACITAFSGITEPALYGVTLKYKRVLTCVMASGGIAGLYAGLTGVVRYSFGAPGIFTLPTFIGSSPKNITNACITAFLAIFLSFIFTYFFAVVDKSDRDKSNIKTPKQEVKGIISGKIVPLEKVDDQVFSSGSLGNGVAINPSSDTVVSPVNAEISMIYPTKHAIGLTMESGQELMIHIGINTAKLKGKGFEVLVENGQKVKVGDPLAKVDFNFIKNEGFDPTIIVVALNTQSEKLRITKKQDITLTDNLFTIY
ncbi:MAG: PTS glucose transporter subunit IIA [Lactobacillus sp.]|uniref:beta-glucoside-specific PTS transporter subunit IIABC n=1 Tax=Bombilactobacillus bombi TaxID=1303590 RepID=UPI0035EF685B|nr:PTS glucose transporter subunit IIA [Lactobacillus sp.]